MIAALSVWRTALASICSARTFPWASNQSTFTPAEGPPSALAGPGPMSISVVADPLRVHGREWEEGRIIVGPNEREIRGGQGTELRLRGLSGAHDERSAPDATRDVGEVRGCRFDARRDVDQTGIEGRVERARRE